MKQQLKVCPSCGKEVWMTPRHVKVCPRCDVVLYPSSMKKAEAK